MYIHIHLGHPQGPNIESSAGQDGGIDGFKVGVSRFSQSCLIRFLVSSIYDEFKEAT